MWKTIKPHDESQGSILIKKYLFAGFGFLAVALGSVGIFLPLIPTTPFFILASFCFLRSSNRYYTWLIHHRLFGKYIYNYLKYKAIPFRTKISAIIMLWVSITLSIILIGNLYIMICLIVVGVSVSIHILSLRTIHYDDMKTEEPSPENDETIRGH